jgi:hypothetical protein
LFTAFIEKSDRRMADPNQGVGPSSGKRPDFVRPGIATVPEDQVAREGRSPF